MLSGNDPSGAIRLGAMRPHLRVYRPAKPWQRAAIAAAGLVCVLAGAGGAYRDHVRDERIDRSIAAAHAETTNRSLNVSMAQAGRAETDAERALADAVIATQVRYRTPDLARARTLATREALDVGRSNAARGRELAALRSWLDAYAAEYGDGDVERAREDVARLEVERTRETSHWNAAVQGVIASTGFATRESVTFEYVRREYAAADVFRARAEADNAAVQHDFAVLAQHAQSRLLALRALARDGASP